MGTRSITSIRSKWDDGDWTTVAWIYRHYDGYLSVHGQWLADFLDGLVMVNGIGSEMPPRYANGPGQLAAQIVAKLQEDGHDPDLVAVDAVCGQEYHYQIDVQYDCGNEHPMTITVFDGPMTAFGMGGEDCTNVAFTGDVEAYKAYVQAAP